jgi:uncharacterized protein YecT (DUF1311 family)
MKPQMICLVLCLLGGSSTTFAQSPVTYQKAAGVALQSQLSKQGKDCPDAQTTRDMNACLAEVERTTKNDFETFYRNLGLLLESDETGLKKLQGSQDKWNEYAASACDAIDYLYREGSIRPSAVMACEIQLRRSRMQDLDLLYHTILHN